MMVNRPWLGAAAVGKVTSERVHSFAKQAGYNVKAIKLPLDINITSMFDETSTEGAGLLDFMTHVPHFRKSVPDDIKSDLLQYLGSVDVSVKTDDGQIFMETDEEILIIENQLK